MLFEGGPLLRCADLCRREAQTQAERRRKSEMGSFPEVEQSA